VLDAVAARIGAAGEAVDAAEDPNTSLTFSAPAITKAGYLGVLLVTVPLGRRWTSASLSSEPRAKCRSRPAQRLVKRCQMSHCAPALRLLS